MLHSLSNLIVKYMCCMYKIARKTSSCVHSQPFVNMFFIMHRHYDDSYIMNNKIWRFFCFLVSKNKKKLVSSTKIINQKTFFTFVHSSRRPKLFLNNLLCNIFACPASVAIVGANIIIIAATAVAFHAAFIRAIYYSCFWPTIHYPLSSIPSLHFLWFHVAV